MMLKLYKLAASLCLYTLVSISEVCLASKQQAFASSEEDIRLVAGEKIESRLLAFVDFNNDRYSDALFSSADNKSLEIHLWAPNDLRPHAYTSEAPGSFSLLQTVKIAFDFTINTAAAADFNRDGAPDVMVHAHKESESITLIYLQKNGRLDEGSLIDITSPASEPSIIDFNGDQVPDLFYADGDGFAVRHLNRQGEVQRLESGKLQGPISSVNSVAFVDVNGDCRPDLMIPREGEALPGGGGNVTYLDFYLAFDHMNGFNKELADAAKTLKFNYPIGYVTFADVQGDGTADMIVPQLAQGDEPAQVHIFVNEQTAPPRDNMCQGSASWLDVDTEGTSPGENHFVVGRMDGQEEFRHGVIRVRAIDINRDARVELLIPLEKGGFDVYVLNGKYQPRTIAGDIDEMVALSGFHDATFFDLGDDGVFDVLAVSDSETFVLRNTYEQDAFFLKTSALDGFRRDSSHKAYGCVSFGGTTKFRVEELNGNSVLRSCYQLTQTASNALQTPYCMVGFGHEQRNSYVRSFWMGLHVTDTGENHYWEWKGIIPNSQLIMFPLDKIPSHWKLELWLDQKRGLLWVGVTVLSTLIVLGITIYFLHRRQLAEEKKERAAQSHLPFL